VKSGTLPDEWEWKKKISERICRIRREEGLSQRELADRLGKQLSVVANIEQMRHLPQLETLCAIAYLFGVSVDYLLGRTDMRAYRPTDDNDVEYIRQLENDNKRLSQHCLQIPVMAKTVKAVLEKMKRVEAAYGMIDLGEIGEENEYLRAE